MQLLVEVMTEQYCSSEGLSQHEVGGSCRYHNCCKLPFLDTLSHSIACAQKLEQFNMQKQHDAKNIIPYCENS